MDKIDYFSIFSFIFYRREKNESPIFREFQLLHFFSSPFDKKGNSNGCYKSFPKASPILYSITHPVSSFVSSFWRDKDPMKHGAWESFFAVGICYFPVAI